jgi:histidinol dehydrogenase
MNIIDFRFGLDRNRILSLTSENGVQTGVESSVAAILEDVRKRGDSALCNYSEKFDRFSLTSETMRVSAEEIRKHAEAADPELVEILRAAIRNIREFHTHQVEESWEFSAGESVRLGVRNTPMDTVGLYIPGGKAAYPSSVLMNAIPAQVAGVNRIVVVTPPTVFSENPLIAAALRLLDLDEVYRIGGAQAIAALAYGSESIPRVDKIVGPGNQYVQAAKRMVYGVVDIDMIAGPSEVAIITDETCDPAWVAADLLAQAEHDEMARTWLICWSPSVAAAVFDEVQVQLQELERSGIARAAIDNHSVAFIVADEKAAIELANILAAEHVEVLMADPDLVADGIRNAGALFVGRYARRLSEITLPGPATSCDRTHGSLLFATWRSGFHEAHEPDSLFRPCNRAVWGND